MPRQLKMLGSGHTEYPQQGKPSHLEPFTKGDVLIFEDHRSADADRLIELGLAEEVKTGEPAPAAEAR